MRIEEILKTMFYSFFVIATGIVASMYVFCLIFYPNVSFSLNDIRAILITALACDLPFFIYYSKRDLSKKQMFIRTIIHFFVLLTVLIYLSHLWNWISLNEPREVAIFVLLVVVVYVIVSSIISYQDKRLAKKLNDNLKERYQ